MSTKNNIQGPRLGVFAAQVGDDAIAIGVGNGYTESAVQMSLDEFGLKILEFTDLYKLALEKQEAMEQASGETSQ